MKRLMMAVGAAILLASVALAEGHLLPGVKMPGGCYFDTGYDVTANPKVTMRFSRNSTACMDAFGSQTAQEGCFILNMEAGGDASTGGYYLRYGTAANNGQWFPANVTGEIVEIECDATLKVNGEIVKTATNVGDFTKSTEPICFPGRRYSGSSAMTVYSFKLEDNGQVVRDMVPYMQDGVVGFWDNVEGKFYAASGSAKPTIAASDRGAATVVWTGKGGDGKWSNAENWQDGIAPLPWAGDTVVIDSTAGDVVCSNDIPQLAVAQVNIWGLENTVTIDGEEIMLTDKTGGNHSCWSNGCPVIVNAPLRHLATETRFNIFSDITLNGTLTFETTTNAVFAGRRNNTTGATTKNVLYGTFNGEIIGPRTTLQLVGANSNTAYYNFYGKLVLDSFQNAKDYGGTRTKVFNTANEVKSVTLAYQVLEVVDDVFHGAVVKFDGYYRETQPLLRLTAGKTYVFGGISEMGKTWEKAGKWGSDHIDTTSANIPTEVILRGTGDVTTAGKFDKHAISVTWDPEGDHVQEFRNRTHEMTGNLTVRGGTLRLAGTNVFQNVSKVKVCAGAKLEIATSELIAFPSLSLLVVEAGGELVVSNPQANAFAANTLGAVFARGAKLKVVDGATVKIGRLVVDGTEVDAGDYTAGDWIEGGGKAAVSGQVLTSRKVWWKAVDGAWGDAANWLGKTVPGAGDDVFFSADGTYKATFASTDVSPKNLTIASDGEATLEMNGTIDWAANNLTVGIGGKVVVPEGAKLTVASESNVSVAGGTFRVDGGDVLLDQYKGNFTVSGTVAATGRLEVAGGLFRYRGDTSSEWANYPVHVKAGGEVDLSGGAIQMLEKRRYAISLEGGRFIASNGAVYDNASAQTIDLHFNEGETVFCDRARICNSQGDSYIYIYPNDKTAKATMTIRDQANLTGVEGSCRYDSITVGNRGNATCGMSELNLDADVNYSGNQHGIICYGMRVGSPNGTGVVNMRKGYMNLGPRGIRIGVSNGGRWGTQYSGGDGTFNLLGGVMRIPDTRVAEGTLDGLTIGLGSAYDPSNPADTFKPWTGRFYMSDGIVTNDGHTCVGGPRATGSFTQVGGTFLGTSATYSFMVGVGGGTGDCRFGGGVADIRNDVYVGGVFTNVLPHSTTTFEFNLVAYGWPLDAHDAVGTLTVSGGSVAFGRNLTVGLDGKGTVAVEGSQADFSIGGDLVLCNNAEPATSSALTFKFDENGVTPIKVAGKVVNAAGTKLTVDIGSFDFKRMKGRLISCGKWEGAELTDVTIIGERADEAQLVRDARGLSVRIPRGALIILQ